MRKHLLLSLKKIGLSLALLVVMLALAGNVFGANRYSVATGNWNSTSTWSASSGGAPGASVPVAGDVVYIEGNRTVTVNANAACATVNISSGSTLAIGGYNFTVSNATNISGILSATSSTGTKSLGAVTFTGGTFNNTSTSNTFAITNLVLSNSTIDGTRTAIFNVSGSMTLNTGTTNTIGNITLNVSGTTNIYGTTVFNSTGGSKYFNGGLTVSNGTLNFSAGETINLTNLTLSGSTITSSNPSTIFGSLVATDNLVVSSGTTNTLNPAQLSINGTVTINGTLNVTNTNGSKTFVGLVTIGSNGNWNNTVNEAYTIRGGITNNGTFTAGAGVYTLNTTAAQTFTGNISIPNLTVNTPTNLTNIGTLTVSTALAGTGTLSQAANATLRIADPGSISLTNLVASANGNTVDYYYSGNQTVRTGGTTTSYYNLILSGSGTKTITGLTTVNGSFTTSGTIIASTAANLTIGGNLNVGAGSSFTIGGYNLTVSGNTVISGIHPHSSATGTKIYIGDVTINSGGSWTNAGNEGFTFQGSLVNNGTLTAGTGVYTFTGSSKTLSGSSGITIPSTTINGSYSNQTTLTVNTALAGTGSLTQTDNVVLNIGGTSGIVTLNATANGNTVNYTLAGNQTILANDYFHLTLSGSGIKTMPSSVLNINGNFTTSGTATATSGAGYAFGGNIALGSGTIFNGGTFSHSVAGNWSNNGATFNPSTGTFSFVGTSSQNIGGSANTTFNCITINNAAGVVLGSAVNASCVTLQNGLLTTTPTNLLTVTGTAPGAITGSANSYVKGPLSRNLPGVTTGNYAFPIGKAGYNPLELLGINTPGAVTIRAEVFDAPCDGTPGVGLSSINTNRYWHATITAGSITNTRVRLTETGLGLEDAIGQSATQTGSYDRVSDDPPSGNTLISWTTPLTELGFFVTGEKPIVTIAASADGKEGYSNGLFTLTTSKKFTVTRDINITIAGTAINGTDYTTITSPITFPAGQSTVTIPVTVINDALVEPTEIVTITLESGTGYAVGTTSSASVAISDNDAAGVSVTPTNGLETSEAAGQTTFSIVLTSQPTANVSVSLSSSNSVEGNVSPTSVTFNSGNWSTPQTITVTGVNDDIDDDDQPYTVITAPATSGDPNYSGINPSDVSVVNRDNDTSGITVVPASGLTVTEASGAGNIANFTIILNTKPTADVTIAFSSNDSSEGTVSPASVTFTPATWNTARTISITGVDDDRMDGNILFNIITSQATSSDNKYAAINPSDVSVTNIDNDVAGFVINPIAGLQTSEAGTSASFTIRLSSQPSANILVSFVSSDTGEGTVSPSSVTFNSSNWNTNQTITLTGVNGPDNDGDQPYSIAVSVSSTTDPSYLAVTPVNVSAINIDDDTPGFTVNPTSLTTDEMGKSASFSIALNTRPQNDVTISVNSYDATEGSISANSLTFTHENWNTPQAIIVTGVNDDVDDGDVTYSIVFKNTISSDADYNNKTITSISVINTDDDEAGITLNPTSGLTTTEATGLGKTATFTLKLNSEPLYDVTIGLSSSNTNEGTVSPLSVTFTTANWNTEQFVTITGVNDDIDDDDIAYTIATAAATSSDPKYNGKNASDVLVTNIDDDEAGFTFSATSGISTTETGGQATFTIRLNAQPTANITIDLSSSNPSEGIVSPSSVTFTSANWSTPQTITITGQNDEVMDGNKVYTINTTMITGGDAKYNALNPPDVTVTNMDEDMAGFYVNPISGLTTTEAGGQATFTIKLTSQPTANVTIGISSSNTNEGTISPSSLTFTFGNWNASQTVTITGVNDYIQDGNIGYTIVTALATSVDPNYNNLNPPDISVTNNDDDVAGITILPTSGLTTTENGGIAQFTVVLTSQPTANVTIGLSSSNTNEGIVSPASLVFIPSEWNIPQTVTIIGADDSVIDGSVGYFIYTASASSSDANYNNRNAADVSVTNTDNDVAAIIVTPTSGLTTTEAGGQATFSIKLATIPTANVTIGLSSSDTNEGTVSPASLVISPANWNAENTVTITGINDDVDDGDKTYTIVTASSSSTDPNYNGINSSDVTVTNSNNDKAGILVEPTSGLVTSENLTSATFTLVLESQPIASVTINLSVSDSKEGQVSPSSVTFTPGNWNTPQTITVTGKDDNKNDGDIVYNVITAPASSSDPKYDKMDSEDVEVTNLDNDSPGITVSPISGLTTTEAGGNATFTVVLTTQPTDDVVISLSSSNTNEGTVSPASLTFTSGNWNSPQTVTITGVNDALVDGDIAYTVILNPAVSDDNDYNAFDPNDVSVTNTDLTPTITLGSTPTICSGTTSANLSYSVTTKSPNQYSIDYDATANASGFIDITNGALPTSPVVLTVPAGAASGTYNATLTVRNSAYTACVSPVYSISVTIKPKTASPTAGSNSPVCYGATVNLTASLISGAVYLWTGPNGFTSTLQNPTIVNAAIETGGTYSVVVTVNGCMSDAGTTLVNISPLVHTNLIHVE